MVVPVVLVVVLVLVAGGCVCVVWAERGGPRWVRGVATVTLAVSGLVGRRKRIRPGPHGTSGDGGQGLSFRPGPRPEPAWSPSASPAPSMPRCTGGPH